MFCQCFFGKWGDGPQNLPCSLPNFKHATFEIPSTKQESATYARTSFICCRVCGLDDGQIERKSGRLPDWSCLVTSHPFAFLASPSIFVQKARISTVQTPLTQEQMYTMFPYKGFGAAAASLVRNWGLPAPVCQCQSCSSDRVSQRPCRVLPHQVPSSSFHLCNPCGTHSHHMHTGTSASTAYSQRANAGTFSHPRAAAPLLLPLQPPPTSSSTPKRGHPAPSVPHPLHAPK